MSEEALSRTAEEFVDDTRGRGGAGELTFHTRMEAVRAPFLGMCDVAFVLEDAEDGLDGVVGEVVGETLTHFGDGRRAAFPQHGHDVELAVGEAGFGHSSHLPGGAGCHPPAAVGGSTPPYFVASVWGLDGAQRRT